MSPIDRRLVELWGNEAEKAELLYGQTDADRAAIAAWHAQCVAVQKGHFMARQVEATDTRAETAPPTARVLFPIWQAEAPLETALQVAVARVHLEAA